MDNTQDNKPLPVCQLRQYATIQGSLTDCPIWQPTRRGINFCATINGLAPDNAGGVSRVFWRKGKGIFRYIPPENLPPEIGQLLEFAGDYMHPPKSGVPSRQRRVRNRVYGVIVKISPEFLVLAEFPAGTSPGIAYLAKSSWESKKIP